MKVLDRWDDEELAVLKKFVKEISVLTLDKDEFLIVKCPEDMSSEMMTYMAKSFDEFMDKKLYGRVLVFKGDINFSKVKLYEKLEVR